MAFYTNNNPNAVKKTTQEIVGPMPAEKTTPAPTYTPAIKSLGEKISGKPTNTAYVPGGSIDSAKTGLVNAQNQSKVNELANAAAKYGIGQMTTNPHRVDYAAEIQRLMGLPQTPENQRMIRKLQGERDAKIALNPELYGQYRNADFDNAVNGYTSRILPETSNTQKILNNMYSRNDDMYRRAGKNLSSQFEYQKGQISNHYDDLRRTALVNAARKTLGNEEILAAQGLGRGVSNPASSGFGESSRMMAQTSLNNNLANSYLAEQQALQELQNQHNQNTLQAYMDYANRANDIDVTALDQGNTDREYLFKIDNANATLAQGDRGLDIQQQSVDNQDEQFHLQLAQELSMHQDELKLSYDELDEMRRSNLANEELAREQHILDKWYKEKSISIEQYVAETGRIAANKKGSSGGGVYDFGDGNPTDDGGGATLSDAQAADIVKMSLAQSGSPATALETLAYLQNNGQISPVMAQTLVDQLGLNKSDGWTNH